MGLPFISQSNTLKLSQLRLCLFYDIIVWEVFSQFSPATARVQRAHSPKSKLLVKTITSLFLNLKADIAIKPMRRQSSSRFIAETSGSDKPMVMFSSIHRDSLEVSASIYRMVLEIAVNRLQILIT